MLGALRVSGNGAHGYAGRQRSSSGNCIGGACITTPLPALPPTAVNQAPGWVPGPGGDFGLRRFIAAFGYEKSGRLDHIRPSPGRLGVLCLRSKVRIE